MSSAQIRMPSHAREASLVPSGLKARPPARNVCPRRIKRGLAQRHAARVPRTRAGRDRQTPSRTIPPVLGSAIRIVPFPFQVAATSGPSALNDGADASACPATSEIGSPVVGAQMRRVPQLLQGYGERDFVER